MTVYLCENSINGLLSALYISFVENEIPMEIIDRSIYQPRFDAYIREIDTNTQNNVKVKTALYNYGGNNMLSHLKTCLYSCNKQALTIAFNYAHLTLETKADVSNRLSNKYVSDFSFTIQQVLHERHLMTGLLRFKESAGNVMYAQYSPDNDITSLLATHFFKRFRQTPFIIHDAKRNKIAISNGKAIKVLYTDLPPTFYPSNNEEEMALLWKKYFNSINIQERLNKSQQNRLFPRRYRQYAYETWE